MTAVSKTVITLIKGFRFRELLSVPLIAFRLHKSFHRTVLTIAALISTERFGQRFKTSR
jgi:hypothetical protein